MEGGVIHGYRAGNLYLYSQDSNTVVLISKVNTIHYVRFSSCESSQGRQREVIKKGTQDRLKGKKNDCSLLFNILALIPIVSI